MPTDETLKRAASLWIAANVALHQEKIGDYFKKADELHQFMISQNLSPEDLRPSIARIGIVPASCSRLNAISGAVSAYSSGAKTREDSTVESGYISAIGKTSDFFMNCRLEKNEQVTLDESLEIPIRYVIVDIMKHIQHVANPGARIGNEDLKELLDVKISAVENLLKDDKDVLERIYARKATHANIKLDKPITSNVDLKKVSLGNNNLQMDWFREALQGRMLINGIPLKKIAAEYGNFESKENVLQFFDEVILEDFKGSAEQKNQAIDYLSKAFHQGGLMYPVTVATTTKSFVNKEGILYAEPKVEDANINIQTNKKGFVLQEFSTFGSVLLYDQKEDEEMASFANDFGYIKPSDTSKPLIKAEGTIEIDFSQNPADPSLTIKSNTIEVNHSGLMKRFDTRNLLQIFIDSVKAFLHINRVEHIRAIKEGLHEYKVKAVEKQASIETQSAELDAEAKEETVVSFSTPMRSSNSS